MKQRNPALLLVLALVLTMAVTSGGPLLAGPFDDTDGTIKIKNVSTEDPEGLPPPPPADTTTPAVAAPAPTTAAAPPAAAPAAQATVAKHTVKTGDTLWAIAQKYLGDGSKYYEIVKANKDKYPGLEKNPNLILPEWELTIPIPGTPPPTGGTTPPAPTAPPAATTPGTTTPPSVPTVPELPTAQKIAKLQAAVNQMNRILHSSGKTLTQLNAQTVRLMIQQGILSEEDWMALNPPPGYIWVIENATVKLVPNGNQSPVVVPPAPAPVPPPPAAGPVPPPPAAGPVPPPPGPVIPLPPAQPQPTPVPTPTPTPTPAPAPAPAVTPEQEAAAKSRAVQNYQKDLAGLGMKDLLARESEYRNAVWKAESFLPGRSPDSPSPFSTFREGWDNLVYRQKQLLEAQKLYEKKVTEGDTDRFLGIFGNNIETAAKKVKEEREKLAKSYENFKALYGKAKAEAVALRNANEAASDEIGKLQGKLAEIDIYNPDNGAKVQAFMKQIKDAQKIVEKNNKKLAYFQPLEQLMGL